MHIENISPGDIEKKSMEIISKELGDRNIDSENLAVIKRVIHTTADFDYADNLYFSENAVELGKAAIKSGACIVTDTNMVLSGINKAGLKSLGSEAVCYMADESVAKMAKERNVTRAIVSMEKSMEIKKPIIYAIGNAPTALIKLCELIKSGEISPKLIIGVPVGFVNVEQSKELLMEIGVPCIVAKGRKGGSNVAAAIVNALVYDMFDRSSI